FGPLAATSRVGPGGVYGLYMRFRWLALMFGACLLIAALAGLAIIGGLDSWIGKTRATEIATTAVLVATYVVVALSYSTIYQATVKLRLWKLGFDTVELSGVEALDRVKAVGATGSALGEGLADALNVSGY